MSETATVKRQLKIKTGIVKRLFKEYNLYCNEVIEQKIKVDKLVAESGDEWDIKNGGKMLQESERMAVDTANRLGTAVGDLRDLVAAVRQNAEFVGSDELLAADDILEEAST